TEKSSSSNFGYKRKRPKRPFPGGLHGGIRGRLVDLHTGTHFNREMSISVSVVQMSDRLGNRQKAMHAMPERVREEPLGYIECGRAVANQRDHLSLAVVDRSYVSVKDLVEITDRFTVASVSEGR